MTRHPSGFSEKGGDRSRSGRRNRRKDAEDRRKYDGLCLNCLNRETCLLPDGEGGVWHCEQYVEEH